METAVLWPTPWMSGWRGPNGVRKPPNGGYFHPQGGPKTPKKGNSGHLGGVWRVVWPGREAYGKPKNDAFTGRAMVGSMGAGCVLAEVRARPGQPARRFVCFSNDNAPRTPYFMDFCQKPEKNGQNEHPGPELRLSAGEIEEMCRKSRIFGTFLDFSGKIPIYTGVPDPKMPENRLIWLAKRV